MSIVQNQSKPEESTPGSQSNSTSEFSLTVSEFETIFILQKVKSANPFLPQGLKKTLTSEATPFIPPVGSNVVISFVHSHHLDIKFVNRSKL